MPLEEPAWWYDAEAKPPLWAPLLAPASWVYNRATARRLSRTGARVGIPVICVGNLTAGGSGKTPTVAYIAERLVARGHRPAILTRGYGGTVRGPTWVTAEASARSVGDEARLLHGRGLPVMVSPDRLAGARQIVADRADIDVILMDDGLQNRRLAHDLSIAVVDAARGFGNGHVIPRGPLRARIAAHAGYVDAALVVSSGSGAAPETPRLAQLIDGPPPVPKMSGRIVPAEDAGLAGARVVAFAGIANPDRFFDTLRAIGADVIATRVFKDHHAFTAGERAQLSEMARDNDARLAATEKDLARLDPASGAEQAFAATCATLKIALALDPPSDATLERLINAAITGSGSV
ncbi:MAG: tetraacyldisaccharide 4'-kinase [Pseudomonadota bacterium]